MSLALNGAVAETLPWTILFFCQVTVYGSVLPETLNMNASDGTILEVTKPVAVSPGLRGSVLMVPVLHPPTTFNAVIVTPVVLFSITKVN